MAGNTTRRVNPERRGSRRVPVLFSAVLTRRGFRTQIVEVLDLSERGAKIQLRFDIPVGVEAVLRMAGPRRKLEVPCAIANRSEAEGYLVAGLSFRVPEEMAAEVREIVERVDAHRRRAAPAAASAPPPAAPAITLSAAPADRVTKRILSGTKSGKTMRRTRSQRPPPGGNGTPRT